MLCVTLSNHISHKFKEITVDDLKLVALVDFGGPVSLIGKDVCIVYD